MRPPHMPPNDPSRVVLYSATIKGEFGPCASSQRFALTSWASERDVEVVAKIEDSIASDRVKITERVGLKFALEALRVGEAGRLIIASWDRLGRSPADRALAIRLVARCGARVVSLHGNVCTPGQDRSLVLSIGDALQQFEGVLQAEHDRRDLVRLTGWPPGGLTSGEDERRDEPQGT